MNKEQKHIYKNDVHIALITHMLQQVDYKKKDKKFLDNDYGLTYPATTENIESKIYE